MRRIVRIETLLITVATIITLMGIVFFLGETYEGCLNAPTIDHEADGLHSLLKDEPYHGHNH